MTGNPVWMKLSYMETASKYRDAFIERVKTARDRTGYNQTQIAKMLGIKQDRYKQYETRSLLPHRLIHMFCLITQCDQHWLLTGEGKAPPKRNHAA